LESEPPSAGAIANRADCTGRASAQTFLAVREPRSTHRARGTNSVARKTKKPDGPKVAGVLGVGLDNEDGHQRITRADGFLLVGGSGETHERMQDVAIRVTESLESKGKRLQDASAEEVIDLIRRAADR
jgi:hypothetical protein